MSDTELGSRNVYEILFETGGDVGTFQSDRGGTFAGDRGDRYLFHVITKSVIINS